MGCNCKGKQEGNDLKFFRSLNEVTKELNKRIPEKAIKDIKNPTKLQIYKQLITLAKNLEKIIENV